MTTLQKIFPRAFGATALLSLVILAHTPARGQTSDAVIVSPKNSDVKVTDSSTPTTLSIKLEGTPATTTDKKADPVPKVEPLTAEQKVENEKKAAKVAADEKKAAEQASP